MALQPVQHNKIAYVRKCAVARNKIATCTFVIIPPSPTSACVRTCDPHTPKSVRHDNGSSHGRHTDTRQLTNTQGKREKHDRQSDQEEGQGERVKQDFFQETLLLTNEERQLSQVRGEVLTPPQTDQPDLAWAHQTLECTRPVNEPPPVAGDGDHPRPAPLASQERAEPHHWRCFPGLASRQLRDELHPLVTPSPARLHANRNQRQRSPCRSSLGFFFHDATAGKSHFAESHQTAVNHRVEGPLPHGETSIMVVTNHLMTGRALHQRQKSR